jgi:RNA polymerase sigma factor (sigma-70 family)
MYRFVRGMVLDAEAAEELTRRAFDRAYSARARFAENLSPAAWLYGFGVQVSMSHLRRRRLGRLLRGRQPAARESGEEEGRSGVEVALEALTPSLRAVALLGLYAHLSSEQIGSILGISEESVGSRLHAATQVMTAALSGGRQAEVTGPR